MIQHVLFPHAISSAGVAVEAGAIAEMTGAGVSSALIEAGPRGGRTHMCFKVA